MIEYAKIILPRIYNWKSLFKKELIKCVNWTASNELIDLQIWCYENFSELHRDVLDEIFNKSTTNNSSDKKNLSGNIKSMEKDQLSIKVV